MFKMSALIQQAKQDLQDFQKMLKPVLDNYFDESLQKLASQYPKISIKVLNVLRDITSRGAKRLRAAFVYYSYLMHGGDHKLLPEVLKVGVVVELIHAYLLIEDDFMDKSALRRGGPTAHRIFTQMTSEYTTPDQAAHVGNSIAVLTSLLSGHMAMEFLNTLQFSPQILLQANLSLQKHCAITIHGQVNDVFNEILPNLTEESVLNVLKWKTSYYTYQNPLHLGAILAGLNGKSLSRISDYALPAGVAFQIQDDILGMFGKSAVTGKSNMEDLKEGKATLLIVKAMELGNAEQQAVLQRCKGNSNLTKADHEAVKKIMEETGALDYSQKMALKLVKQAQVVLDKNAKKHWQEPGVSFLGGVMEYMIHREL